MDRNELSAREFARLFSRFSNSMKQLFLIWQMESATRSSLEMEEIFQIVPTKLWAVGDWVGKSLVVRRSHGIQIEERTAEFEEVGIEVKAFVQKYAERVSTGLACHNDITALLQIIVYSPEREGMYLENETLSILARTGSALDFDPYCLSDYEASND